MAEYSEECLNTFLDLQEKLFDPPVAETLDEAEDVLEDCMADVVDTIDDVRDYLEDMGMDTHGMTDEELENASEIFPLPSGKYLIVSA